MILPHRVKVVRNEGTADQKAWDACPAFVQAKKSFFDAEPLLEKGDVIYWDQFPEKMVVAKVSRCTGPQGIHHQEAELVPFSEWETMRTQPHAPTVQQKFYGPVSAVAGGTITQYNITMAQYFEVLISLIEQTPAIPPGEKESLISKIKQVANNPYISGIASNAVYNVLKGLIGL